MVDKTAIVNAAQKFSSKGQIDKAIAEWQKLLEEKQDGNVHNNIGDLYLRKGSESEAIEAFANAADVFKKEGFFPKAIALYKKILNIVPHNVDSLIALAKLNAEKGLIGNAVENYFKAVEIFHRDGATEKTIMAIEKIVQLSPSDINTRIKIADLYMRSGHRERAASEYSEIASFYFSKENDEKALEYYQNAIQFDAENVPAYIGLSKLSEKSGDMDKALDYLDQALPFDPDNIDLMTVYSRLAIKTGNTDDAINALTVIIESDPTDINSKKLLGNIYLEKNRPEDAWKELLPCIEEATKNQDWPEALELSNNFKELYPIPVEERIVNIHRLEGNKDALGTSLTELASLYEVKGENDDILRLYKEILELNPDDSTTAEKIRELEISMGIAQPAEEPVQGNIENLTELTTNEVTEAPLKENSSENNIMSDMLMSTHESNQSDNNTPSTGTLEPERTEIDEFIITNELAPTNEDVVDPQKNAGISPIEFAEMEEEADSLVQQGMEEDAIKIYKDLLSSFSDNEGITKKLEAIKPKGPVDEHPAEAKEVSAPEESNLQDIFNEFGNESPDIQTAEKAPKVDSDLQDIFSEFGNNEPPAQNAEKTPKVDSDLQDIFSEFGNDEPPAQNAEKAPKIDSDLEDIFDNFEKKEEKPKEVNYEAHYSSALAYKQKGLFDEAINEFRIASKDPGRTLMSSTLIALCYMEKSDYPHAIEEFNKIIENMPPEDGSYLRIKYELAGAHMNNKDHNKALKLYTEIRAQDPDFKNSTEKIEALKSMLEKPSDDQQTEKSPEKPKPKKSRVSYI